MATPREPGSPRLGGHLNRPFDRQRQRPRQAADPGVARPRYHIETPGGSASGRFLFGPPALGSDRTVSSAPPVPASIQYILPSPPPTSRILGHSLVRTRTNPARGREDPTAYPAPPGQAPTHGSLAMLAMDPSRRVQSLDLAPKPTEQRRRRAHTNASAILVVALLGADRRNKRSSVSENPGL